MIKKFTELEQLSYDIVKNRGKVQYNETTGDEAVRKIILDALELGENYTAREYKNAYRANSAKFFQVIEELVNPMTGVLLTDQLNHFVDVEEVELNEKKEFIFNDPSLFRVGIVSDGNLDVRRQTIVNGKFTVETKTFIIKIYTDLNLFLTGKIDWVELCLRVQKSFAMEIQKEIGRSIYKAFDGASEGDYYKTGTFDEQKLLDIISNVSMDTNSTVAIYGTKKALAKVKGATDLMSNDMKNDLNLLGHFKQFQGTPMYEIPQARLNDRSKAIPDDALIIVPEGGSIVKVVFEGDTTIYETEAGVRNDEQMEYLFKRKAGVGVAKPSIFGMYKLA